MPTTTQPTDARPAVPPRPMKRGPAVWVALAAAVAALHGLVLNGLGRPAAADAPSGNGVMAGAMAAVQPVQVVGAPMPLPAVRTEEAVAEPAGAAPAPVVKALPAPAAPRIARARPLSATAVRPLALAVAPAPAERSAAAAETAIAEAPAVQLAAAMPAATPAEQAVAPPATDAGTAGAADATDAAAADDGPPPPVYRTRIPPPWRVEYRLSRSGIVGSGTIDWQPADGSYLLRLEGSVPIFGTLIVQTSRGRFDAAGLAPERFTDKRVRRTEQAANFQRAAGKVSFSGQSTELPLTPGVQDRVSVMVQLGAIANAWSKPPAVGTEVRIRVIGSRGDGSVWALRYQGRETVQTPGGTAEAWRFLRESDSPHGTRAEFWLDPGRHCLPIKARLTDGNGDALELQRTASVP